MLASDSTLAALPDASLAWAIIRCRKSSSSGDMGDLLRTPLGKLRWAGVCGHLIGEAIEIYKRSAAPLRQSLSAHSGRSFLISRKATSIAEAAEAVERGAASKDVPCRLWHCC